jgi:hypothetical protein
VAVEAKCVFLRAGTSVADIGLVRDVADAFKHHRPHRQTAVVASSDVILTMIGFGKAPFGEGKFDGEQVIITTTTGHKRAQAYRHRSRPQSSSASRFPAGAAGFFILSQSGDRPER